MDWWCVDEVLWFASSSLRKLYVAVSVGVCLLVSSLVLFFLFPRSVLLSPVAVKSSFVYVTEDDVQINITVGRESKREDGMVCWMKKEKWKVWMEGLIRWAMIVITLITLILGQSVICNKIPIVFPCRMSWTSPTTTLLRCRPTIWPCRP